jgi:hypothetical protein
VWPGGLGDMGDMGDMGGVRSGGEEVVLEDGKEWVGRFCTSYRCSLEFDDKSGLSVAFKYTTTETGLRARTVPTSPQQQPPKRLPQSPPRPPS